MKAENKGLERVVTIAEPTDVIGSGRGHMNCGYNRKGVH